MVRVARDGLGRAFWPCCVAALLAVDYLVSAQLLRAGRDDWGVVRAAYVDFAHRAGQGYMLLVLAALVALAGSATGRRQLLSAAQWLAGLVLLTGFWAQLIKHVVGRPRPRMWDACGALLPIGPTIRASWDSFPSGHAMTVFAAVPLLEALCPWAGRGWLALATFIAVGRVVGCDHYLTDVLVGALLGLAIGRYARTTWQAAEEATNEHV